MTVKKYRRKPINIEAFQLTDDLLIAHVIDKKELPFSLRCCASTSHPPNRVVMDFRLLVETKHGEQRVHLSNWVIKKEGTLMVCDDDVFQHLYEELQLPNVSEGK